MKRYKKISLVVLVGLLAHLSTSQAAVTCVVNKATGLAEGTPTKPANPECNLQFQSNVLAGMLAGQEVEESEGTKIIGGSVITNAPKLSSVVAAADRAKRDSLAAEVARMQAADAARMPEIKPVQAAPVAPKPGSAATEVAVAPALAFAKPLPAWTLNAGRTVGQELQAWGEKAGWKVVWTLAKDWSVPATTGFGGDFKTAAGDVIKTLAANGALVRAQFYDGNQTMVVSGPGALPQ